MGEKPMSGAYQFTSATAAHLEEIANKIQTLGSGTGVGVNYNRGSKEMAVRFCDHAHGIGYLELAPAEMATLKSYVEQRHSPEDAKVLRLLADGEGALTRAREYLAQEKIEPKTAPELKVSSKTGGKRHLHLS